MIRGMVMSDFDPMVIGAAALSERLDGLLAHPRYRYLAASIKAGTLTPAERAEVEKIQVVLDSVAARAVLAFDIEDDEGAAVRRLMGARPEALA